MLREDSELVARVRDATDENDVSARPTLIKIRQDHVTFTKLAVALRKEMQKGVAKVCSSPETVANVLGNILWGTFDPRPVSLASALLELLPSSLSEARRGIAIGLLALRWLFSWHCFARLDQKALRVFTQL